MEHEKTYQAKVAQNVVLRKRDGTLCLIKSPEQAWHRLATIYNGADCIVSNGIRDAREFQTVTN